MNRGNDGAVRERKRPFLIGLDRYVVAELSTQLVGLAFYQKWSTAINFQSRYPAGIVTP